MFPFRKLEPTGLSTDYAKRADFCEVLERNMKPLYLLAFLLTANHRKAEQCFVATVEESFKEQAVFKDWVPSWVKRCLIRNAIRYVSPTSARGSEKRDLWSAAQAATLEGGEINAVAELAPLERFVFAMSVLERYSDRECSLLLGCGTKKVAGARMRALAGLSRAGVHFAEPKARPSRHLEVTAYAEPPIPTETLQTARF